MMTIYLRYSGLFVLVFADDFLDFSLLFFFLEMILFFSKDLIKRDLISFNIKYLMQLIFFLNWLKSCTIANITILFFFSKRFLDFNLRIGRIDI